MNISAVKAKSNESDRIGSLLLASLEEPPSKSATKSSSPKQKDRSPKEDFSDWSPDYGFDDGGMTDDDLSSMRSVITGGASSYRSRSLGDTPSARSNSSVFSRKVTRCQLTFTAFHLHHQLFLFPQTVQVRHIPTHLSLRCHPME